VVEAVELANQETPMVTHTVEMVFKLLLPDLLLIQQVLVH
jgi:hypothetical protein